MKKSSLASAFLLSFGMTATLASAETETAPAGREKGIACTTTVKSRQNGTELTAQSKTRINSVADSRRLRSVRTFPKRDVALGKLTIIESVLEMNFERPRPRATLEVVFEAQGGGRDSIKVREVGRGKSSQSMDLPLADGSTLFVDVELHCRYYRS